MTNYKQLGLEQGYVIDRLLRQGKSQKEIADVLGYHKSTISRELRRNTPPSPLLVLHVSSSA